MILISTFIFPLVIIGVAGRNVKQIYNESAHQKAFIVNGTTTEPGKWPWMVRIIKKGIFPYLECGGVLIGSNVVLSAGHCFERPSPPSEFEVKIGDWDRNLIEPVERNIGVKHVIQHSGFLEHHRPPFYVLNDISMLILNDHVPCAKNIRPIPLPFADQHVSMVEPAKRIAIKDLAKAECVLTGWGLTQNDSEADQLQKLQYPGLFGPEDCDKMCNKSGFTCKMPPGVICSQSKPFTSGCNGDSGGPLVCKVNQTWYLFGLDSWGVGGCSYPYIEAFTDVGYFFKWIYSTLATYPEAAKGVWQSFQDCSKYQYSSMKQWKYIEECKYNSQLLGLMGFYCGQVF